MALLYRDLRRRAAAYLRRERRGGATLQPTALVNEAYIRLAGQRDVSWQNRSHFLAIASGMMRRILVDRARGRRMAKRSGAWARVTLEEAAQVAPPVSVDILDLDAALSALAEFDPRKARLVELRFFGGLSLEEASAALGVSVATAERDWQIARAWLFKQLRAR